MRLHGSILGWGNIGLRRGFKRRQKARREQRNAVCAGARLTMMCMPSTTGSLADLATSMDNRLLRPAAEIYVSKSWQTAFCDAGTACRCEAANLPACLRVLPSGFAERFSTANSMSVSYHVGKQVIGIHANTRRTEAPRYSITDKKDARG